MACANNMKQINLSIASYLNESGGFYPRSCWSDGGYAWWTKTQPIPSFFGYDKWSDSAYKKWNAATVLNCPASQEQSSGDYYDYAVNKHLCRSWDTPSTWIRENAVKHPQRVALFFDRKSSEYWGIVQYSLEYSVTQPPHERIWTNRHHGGFNVLWVDGHVSWLSMGGLKAENFGPSYW